MRRTIAARSAVVTGVVLLKGAVSCLDLLPGRTTAGDSATYRVSTEPSIGSGYEAVYATAIAALAGNIEFRRDQLLCQQVGLILAGGVPHDRDRLRLSIGYTPKGDRLHAPGLRMVLPVTVTKHTAAWVRARCRSWWRNCSRGGGCCGSRGSCRRCCGGGCC